MEDFKEVVSDTTMRVTAGGYVTLLEPGIPRKVNPTLYRAALSLGATDVAVAKAVKEKPKRAAPKKRQSGLRRSKKVKEPTPSSLINDAAEFIKANIDDWSEDDYDLSGVPRMNLFADSVPGLTTDLRDQGWEFYTTVLRDS